MYRQKLTQLSEELLIKVSKSMKRFLLITVLSFILFVSPSISFAQPMPAPSGEQGIETQSAVSSDGHTAREEAEGKEISEKLQAKRLECKNLTDDNFESLGEYFMGQMTGTSHEAMNTMMERMMGKQGEEQMHVVMGKRMSGCGVMPMMNMMMGYGWNNMMGWGGFGILGWVSMILFWLLLVLGVVALVKWFTSGSKTSGSKTPLEILKERYANGEIDKKKFERMKKDIV